MNIRVPLVALAFASQLAAAEVPKIFSGLLQQDTAVKGQIGIVLPPPEIDKYVAKVDTAARNDPKWFREFSESAKSGAPLPYDERLGLTKAEYDEYIALWNKREFKPIEDVVLVLRQSAGDTWTVTSTGNASILSTLRYSIKSDTFRSPNGELKRLDDIKADATTILGEWTAGEWRFEEDTTLGKMKENFAVGRYTGKNYGLLVYRAQEISAEGRKLLDKSLVIRFPIGAASPEKPAKPAPKTAPKPAPKKR